MSLNFCMSCGGLCPSLLDLQDFLGCGWSGWGWQKSGCDDLAAELGEHVPGGWFSLGPVPGSRGATLGRVGVVVAVEHVPHGQDAVTEQSERDSSLDCFLGPVAGLTDPEDVLDIKKVTSIDHRAA